MQPSVEFDREAEASVEFDREAEASVEFDREGEEKETPQGGPLYPEGARQFGDTLFPAVFFHSLRS